MGVVGCDVLGDVFFSSRRRHTSSKRDWSSDVCSSDLAPTVSYALTVGARGVIGAAATGWRLYYTRVTNLTYRNEDSLQVPLYHSLVTGRNFDDYDQLTGTLALLPRAGLLLTPEITYLRQGEGDPRLPHPDVSAYPTTPVIFAGVVERTLRLA